MNLSATRTESVKTLDALIVDDESASRRNLRNLLAKFCPEINIIGEASTVEEGHELIELHQPQVLFQDICMPGTAGLEFVEYLLPYKLQVIFVTAFDNYTMRALKASAVDYLLKPVKISELKDAVNKLFEARHFEYEKLLRNFGQQLSGPEKLEKIALPSQNGFELVDIEKIVFIEADNSYAKVHMTEGKPLLISKSIGDFDKILEPENFYRIHNSYLINLKQMTEFTSIDGGMVHMSGEAKLPVAKRRLANFKEKARSVFHNFK